MKTGVRIRRIFFSALAVCLTVLSVLVLGTNIFNTPPRFDIVQLDDGWTVSRGGISWDLASIVRSNIGIAGKGDVITLTRTLPKSYINPATIHYRTVLSTTEVYVDGSLIYSFGKEFSDSGKMVPKMENFVQLPGGYSEKEISIVITAQEDDAFSGLSPITFGNYNDIKNNLLQSNRLSMIIGVYLCHLGFLLLIVAPYLAFSRNHDFSIFFSAVASVMMGVYILCYNDIFWYISDNPYFYTFVEYFSLFMIPASILGFALTAGRAYYRTIGFILFIINLGFVLFTSLSHFTNMMHICRFVPFLHALGLCEGLFVIISLVRSALTHRKEKDSASYNSSSTYLLIGSLIFFLVCSLIDIVKFNIMKFTKLGEINAHINFLTIGALVFIMDLLLNYFYHCIEYITESSSKVRLEGLAYTDPLTGLSNRARCEQVLAELEGSFTIVSLDLDYLKYTNDNFGHDQGDKLLSGFAELLLGSFTDATLVGRMGGDEFIAVLPYVDDERTKRDLDCLTDQLSHRNQKESRLRFSASWGYATSKDRDLKGDNSAQNVYLLADTRMYAMKNLHHKASLGRLYDDLLNKVLGEGGST